MTYQEKLVRFMRVKASLLPGKFKRQYFHVTDAKAILKWSDSEAETVYSAIISAYTNKESPGDVETCPFCIHTKISKDTMYCEFCEYGKHHGMCSSYGSTYYKIMEKHSSISFLCKDEHALLLEALGVES